MSEQELASGEAHAFGTWPTTPVPKGPPGVYTVWDGTTFLYVGMSWREPTTTTTGTSLGLWGRLNSHASGRRSGDQFCIYICDRFVIGSLTPDELVEVATGHRSLDRMTRDFVRRRLSYRYITTTTGADARAIEAAIRKNGLTAHGTPLLNPSTDTSR